MGFQDVDFLLPRASFYITFLKIWGRTTTCHKSVIGVSKSHDKSAHAKILPTIICCRSLCCMYILLNSGIRCSKSSISTIN